MTTPLSIATALSAKNNNQQTKEGHVGEMEQKTNHDTLVGSDGFVRRWKQQSINKVGKREGIW
jgi:hypothetical protein